MEGVRIFKAMKIKRSRVLVSKSIIHLTFFDDSYPTLVLPLCYLTGNTGKDNYLLTDESGEFIFEDQDIFRQKYLQLSDGYVCLKASVKSN